MRALILFGLAVLTFSPSAFAANTAVTAPPSSLVTFTILAVISVILMIVSNVQYNRIGESGITSVETSYDDDDSLSLGDAATVVAYIAVGIYMVAVALFGFNPTSATAISYVNSAATFAGLAIAMAVLVNVAHASTSAFFATSASAFALASALATTTDTTTDTSDLIGACAIVTAFLAAVVFAFLATTTDYKKVGVHTVFSAVFCIFMLAYMFMVYTA